MNSVRPPGVLSTVVQRFQLFHVCLPSFVIDGLMSLGSPALPFLWGPTPASLVPANMMGNIDIVIPPVPFQRPRHVRDSVAARSRRNWRIQN